VLLNNNNVGRFRATTILYKRNNYCSAEYG
jgi:hypothetical protein